MRVLLIKTSSMGDLIHSFPALSDAQTAIKDIQFDWLVEEGFEEIPHWHPAVDRVIKVAHRRWRHHLLSIKTWKEIFSVRNQLREQRYDLVLDAQGLVKSAWFTWFVKAPRKGLDWSSARESFASLFYQKKYTVNRKQHAVRRMRLLFSLSLGYPFPSSEPEFNLKAIRIGEDQVIHEPYLVFLHGTTWGSKQWPKAYWLALARLAAANGFKILISGGKAEEVARANEIAQQCDAVVVRPYLSIAEMAQALQASAGVVAVDTGFGHLAAALGLPLVSVYGSTDPAFTGAIGGNSAMLSANFPCSPCLQRECSYREPSEVKPACYATLPPGRVWQVLQSAISG